MTHSEAKSWLCHTRLDSDNFFVASKLNVHCRANVMTVHVCRDWNLLLIVVLDAVVYSEL